MNLRCLAKTALMVTPLAAGACVSRHIVDIRHPDRWRDHCPTLSNPGEPEVISALGRSLFAGPPGTDRDKLEADLAAAGKASAADPDNPERDVWLGRRMGYLWRMHDAVCHYSLGIAYYPDYAPLYRHRGHRYISLRRFDDAIVDLEKAATLVKNRPDEIEPDGAPNARNIPLTTTAFNIWYHLGLARYLTGDFEGALQAYRKTMRYTRDYDDNIVASIDWMYMTLRRLGRQPEAEALLSRIRPDMEMIENTAYHRRLLMYKGLISPEALLDVDNANDLDLATLGYGLGNWYLYNGDEKRAIEIFERVTSAPCWPAFGYIAAEADLARLQRP